MAAEKSPQGKIRDDGTRGVLHLIENDVPETWVEDWAGAGVTQIEDYLEKHLAFLAFLEDNKSSAVQEE